MSGAPGAHPDSSSAQCWETPTTLPPLPSATIHIWKLTAAQRLPDELSLPLLEPAEQERASRFLFNEDRRQFVACRVTLRLLLGHYLGLRPREVRFSAGLHGKPGLAGGGVRFNLSHTRDLALFAFTREIEVGVDVEQVRATGDLDDVAEYSFALQERDTLQALPDEDRVAAFYRCWTRKEALLKAEGTGLFRDLTSFAVPVRPAANGEVLSTALDGWELAHLDVAPDVPGAVAWQRCIPPPKLMLFDLPLSLLRQ